MLPYLNHIVPSTKQEVVSFRGVNWSEQASAGELRDSLNLSARKWPCLTTRRGRTQQPQYTGCTALVSRGKLVAVQGTTLLYDGQPVGTVTPGEKQFAVVNTKLCIWPDKVWLDLNSREFRKMEAEVSTVPGGSATFTGNQITMTGTFGTVTEEHQEANQGGSSGFANGVLIRRYASVSWNNGWVLTGEEEVTVGGHTIGSPISAALRVGDLVMLKATDVWGNYQLNTRTYDMDRDDHIYHYGTYTENHAGGYYARITNLEWTNQNVGGVVTVITNKVTFQVLNAINQMLNLSQIFKAGDRVTISGCASIPGNNTGWGVHKVVRAVTANTMTFPDGSFFAGTEMGVFTIKRDVPDLDYICESENRLWGCSNAARTIYASSLGDPSNFYVYDGLSTDGYAVAVGSEGDFTGICKQSSAVLAWKETKLHKVLGSYPAEYTLYTYDMEGLAHGCNKSLVIINETLFYMGLRGVYVYSGGTPSLISACFGEKQFSQGIAGTDGERYYLSVKEGDAAHLLVYEPKYGVWLREDGTRGKDFARMGKDLYMLDDQGKVWLLDNGTQDPDQLWAAEFVPFYVTMEGRKRFARATLRVELPKGAWMRAKVRTDGGPWRETGKIVGRDADCIPFQLPANRCDKLELRLSGKGPCTVRGLLLEYTVGSDV